MTHHVESFKLESEVLEKKSKSSSNYQENISQDFRTPLTTILMFLETLLGGGNLIGQQARQMILIIIYEVNLLLGIVNDILDYKLIEEDKFVPKIELFSLEETFRFIINMFTLDVTI